MIASPLHSLGVSKTYFSAFMNQLVSHPLFSLKQKRTLSLVLAILVTVCALMIVIPGISNELGANTMGSHCLNVLDLDEESSPNNAANLHEDGASTVCSGDSLTFERTVVEQLASLFIVLVVFHSLLLLTTLVSSGKNPLFQQFGPPFQGQIRSHLALRRIHI